MSNSKELMADEIVNFSMEEPPNGLPNTKWSAFNIYKQIKWTLKVIYVFICIYTCKGK